MASVQMKVVFPHTNPLIFKKGVAVEDYHDNDAYEFQGGFCQTFSTSDRLSFQFSWENIPANGNRKVEVKMHVSTSAIPTTVYTKLISSMTEGKDDTGYSLFTFTHILGNGCRNGFFQLSKKISELNITNGATVYFTVIDPLGNTWTSNTFRIDTNTEGTKKIHYSNTCAEQQDVFDTHFGYMVQGYDLRLPAYFTEYTPASDTSLFMDMKGGSTLVSAVPYTTIKLNIGGKYGLPREYVRLLNMVMHLDEKNIDGKDYELSDGDLSIDIQQGYSNDFYSVVLVEKDGRYGDIATATGNVNVIVSGNDNQTSKPITFGSVDINSDTPYFIDSTSINSYEFERVSAGAGKSILKYKAVKNTTNADITDTFSIKSTEDGTTLKTFTITRKKTFARGIGVMVVNDNLIVR